MSLLLCLTIMVFLIYINPELMSWISLCQSERVSARCVVWIRMVPRLADDDNDVDVGRGCA